MLRDGSSSLRRNLGVFDAGFSSGQITGGRLTERRRKEGKEPNTFASFPSFFCLMREEKGERN